MRNFFAGDNRYIYFQDENNLLLAKKYFEDHEADIKFESDNAFNIRYNGRDFDLIKHFFEDPQDSINSFDFTVACVAVDNQKVHYHDTFFIDLAKRALVINELPYPMSSLSRTQKYIKKGFTICQGGLYQLSRAVQSQLNESDSDALRNTNDSNNFDPEDLIELSNLSSRSRNSLFSGID